MAQRGSEREFVSDRQMISSFHRLFTVEKGRQNGSVLLLTGIFKPWPVRTSRGLMQRTRKVTKPFSNRTVLESPTIDGDSPVGERKWPFWIGFPLSQERSQSSCSLKLWSTGSPERLGARASEVQERRHGNGHAVAGRENTLES
jgi:hypothetical protein